MKAKHLNVPEDTALYNSIYKEIKETIVFEDILLLKGEGIYDSKFIFFEYNLPFLDIIHPWSE